MPPAVTIIRLTARVRRLTPAFVAGRRPGSVAGRKGRKMMAPHVNFWLASRGINIGLATRMYFGDEEAANSEDPVLNIVEQPERRKTLIAARSERDGVTVYTFDIYLQGDRETVFFDI